MNPIKYLEHCKHLLSSLEVSEILDCHQETVYRYKNAGKLKHVRVGRSIKFDPMEVLRFLGQLSG
jgi:excisionase family DNA binding protein